MTELRIRVQPMQDYPWPFVAILEREGGDSEADAVEALTAEHRQARGIIVHSIEGRA